MCIKWDQTNEEEEETYLKNKLSVFKKQIRLFHRYVIATVHVEDQRISTIGEKKIKLMKAYILHNNKIRTEAWIK